MRTRPIAIAAACTAAVAVSVPALARAGGTSGQPAAAAPSDGGVSAPLPHVEVLGSGPVPMVLVPGLSFDWTVFKAFAERNGEAYTMYAVTLPGFGGSEPPPAVEGRYGEAPWLENAERAIVGLIRERKLDRPVLVGHSMGAHLVLRIAAEHPELTRGVVAIDGLPAFPLGAASVPAEQRKQVVETQLAPRVAQATDEQFLTQWKSSVTMMVKDEARASALADMAGSVPKNTIARYYLELLASDVTEQLKSSETPKLVIAAISGNPMDRSTPEQQRVRIADALAGIPKMQIAFFEDTRHFVMDDAPAELDRAIAQFVKGEPVEGKTAAAAEGGR